MKSEAKFVITKNDTIKALYRDDFEIFMSKIGLLEAFQNGEIVCKYCGHVVTRENLHALIPSKDGWSFCCNDSKCIIKFANESGKHQKESTITTT
jgi:hypothetical protein